MYPRLDLSLQELTYSVELGGIRFSIEFIGLAPGLIESFYDWRDAAASEKSKFMALEFFST